MTWTDYWNADSSVYVNARHRSVHYDMVTRDILKFVPAPDATVVDYGCGDTLSADRLADACGHLYLCDGAQRVRERLIDRYAGRSDISVITPEEFMQLAPHTIGLIVANSVIQYLSMPQFTRLLEASRDKLRIGDRLLLADVVPRSVSPMRDAYELLKFAAANRFLVPAVGGLLRSYFSGYRQVREELGFLQFDEAEMIELLRQSGFAPRRQRPNIGHNTARMAFLAEAR